MKSYTVQEKNGSSYVIEAINVSVEGGALIFWSETERIRIVSGSLWERVMLNPKRKEGSDDLCS